MQSAMWLRCRYTTSKLLFVCMKRLLLVLLLWGGMIDAPLVLHAQQPSDSVRTMPARTAVQLAPQRALAQRMRQHPMLKPAPQPSVQVRSHPYQDRTIEFLVLLLFTLLLGGIRFVNPRYFGLLWRAFYHPTHTSQALRDQLEADPVPNSLMNGLFACVVGSYLYSLLHLYHPQGAYTRFPEGALIGIFIAGVGLIYGFKWVAIRLSGWSFGVSALTSEYLFNVFLINKVLAIFLLPFTIVLAFADAGWAQLAVVLSWLMIAILIAMRYTRSWLALRSFFSNSRFHFLTYFCASEILPLAVLTKLVVRALAV